jgi:ribosomal protein L31
VKSNKCATMNCDSTRDRGPFFADLCGPCHNFVTTGTGTNNAVFKNATRRFNRRMREKLESAKISLEQARQGLVEALDMIKPE